MAKAQIGTIRAERRQCSKKKKHERQKDGQDEMSVTKAITIIIIPAKPLNDAQMGEFSLS